MIHILIPLGDVNTTAHLITNYLAEQNGSFVVLIILAERPEVLIFKKGDVRQTLNDGMLYDALSEIRVSQKVSGKLKCLIGRYFNEGSIIIPIYGTRAWIISSSFIGSTEQLQACVAVALKNAEAYERLKKEAAEDPLTGLYNKKYLYIRLREEMARADRTGEIITVLMLDIDSFKEINDCHGHVFGDRVLKKVAQTIKRNIRTSDIASRFGGDEFVVVFAGLKNAKEAECCIERIKKEIYEEMGINASTGIAVYRKGKRKVSPEDLISAADEDMYREKKEIQKNYL